MFFSPQPCSQRRNVSGFEIVWRMSGIKGRTFREPSNCRQFGYIFIARGDTSTGISFASQQQLDADTTRLDVRQRIPAWNLCRVPC